MKDVFYVTEGLNISTRDAGKSKHYLLYLKQAFMCRFISLSIEAKHEQRKYALNVSPIFSN